MRGARREITVTRLGTSHLWRFLMNELLMQLSPTARHAFQVALLLSVDVTPDLWYYAGEYRGKYVFRHKVTGGKVVV
jgi:hypothetical protein